MPQSRTHTGRLLALVGVFGAATAWFLLLQSEPVFPDPDSFYHIKVAQLIAGSGVVESFPWLTYTTLGTAYTDQHFLYHVLLAPFVTLLNPVAGAKLATVLVNATLLTLFSAFLIRFRVRWWWAFVLILFVTNPFLFRINLVKAPGLSLILLLTGLWLLFSRRRWPLAVLGFLYVWTYGGFALLAIIGALYAVVSLLLDWHHHTLVDSVFRRLAPRRHQWKRFCATRRLFKPSSSSSG